MLWFYHISIILAWITFITVVIRNANSIISSEVLNWCSFVGKKALSFCAHATFSVFLFVFVSQCTHGFSFIQCVIVFCVHAIRHSTCSWFWPWKCLQSGSWVFWDVPSGFEPFPAFLSQKDVPGFIYAFPESDLESVISLWNLFLLSGE